jgi:crotonobetainyl-CoA:carnitine CoA-transferase CaiB-like acyl-CoA transferase
VRPLEGLRVLDLSRLLPGPYATLVLADLGATVDKLEDPNGGDYIRAMGPGLFGALNRNKRSVTLDLKGPKGAATLKRLVKRYDVLVESFRPGVMQKLGVGYEALAEANPRLVYCAISGYGQTGPDRLKAGHDIDYIARAGTLAYGGEPNGRPALPGAQVGDISGALFGLIGLFAALYERQATGKGRFVDISMTETSMAFIHMHLGARMLAGNEGQPLRRGVDALNGGYACYGLYETQDHKWLAVGALEPKFFQGVCAVLERPDLFEHAYDTGGGSARVRGELEKIFKTKARAEWLQAFAAADVCVEPVNEGDEVLADPQLVARGMFVGEQLRTPVNLGPLPMRAPPELGQHTAEVLAEAGFEKAEIAEMLGPA